MILSADPAVWLAMLGIMAYLTAVLPANEQARWPVLALKGAWMLQALALVAGAWWHEAAGLRIGFAPVLSFTLWLVLGVYAVEGHFVPMQGPRRVLAWCGAASLALALWFPGEILAVAHSRWAPLHWVLGLTSYGLFGTAVLHALMLDSAERQLRPGAAAGHTVRKLGVPLLRLERLTFRFVESGFVVLTLALVLGAASGHWRWDHKTVLSLLGWATFATLLAGRRWRGWRGQQATRCLYAGALLLLLAYVGSRFVLEVVLQRGAG
jgi:ABC-type uncharacterized transport system permease subunit